MIKILNMETGEDITYLVDAARRRTIEDTELKLRGCPFPERLTTHERNEKLNGVVVRASRTERKSMFFE